MTTVDVVIGSLTTGAAETTTPSCAETAAALLVVKVRACSKGSTRPVFSVTIASTYTTSDAWVRRRLPCSS